MRDMGTDPISRHQTSEHMQHGSSVHKNSSEEKLTMLSQKSVQVSVTSEQLLPSLKIKQKPEQANVRGRNQAMEKSRSAEQVVTVGVEKGI